VALADYIDSLTPPDIPAILKSIESILRENISNDRIVIPAMEATAALFEEGIVTGIRYEYLPFEASLMSFRPLFIVTQKVAYKSGNITKILACVRMYAAFLNVCGMEKETLKKMCSMLLHPLPRVGG
jgi:hypothetical protein